MAFAFWVSGLYFVVKIIYFVVYTMEIIDWNTLGLKDIFRVQISYKMSCLKPVSIAEVSDQSVFGIYAMNYITQGTLKAP